MSEQAALAPLVASLGRLQGPCEVVARVAVKEVKMVAAMVAAMVVVTEVATELNTTTRRSMTSMLGRLRSLA